MAFSKQSALRRSASASTILLTAGLFCLDNTWPKTPSLKATRFYPRGSMRGVVFYSHIHIHLPDMFISDTNKNQSKWANWGAVMQICSRGRCNLPARALLQSSGRALCPCIIYPQLVAELCLGVIFLFNKLLIFSSLVSTTTLHWVCLQGW